MRTHRSTRRPFAERSFYTDADIESLCVDELSKVALFPDSPQPIRIDRFIEKRFGRPHDYADLEDGILGLTVFGPRGVEQIVVSEALENEGTTPATRRLRTTLAHEAGHGLLHAHLFVLGQVNPTLGDWTDQQRPKVLCRDPHQVSRTSGVEFQANMVMSTILLPRQLVEQAVRPFCVSTGSLGLMRLDQGGRERAIRQLAEVFDVNPVVVRIRLSKLFPEAGSTGQLTL